MSQNRTVVPGMEGPEQYSQGETRNAAGFYNRTQNTGRGTVVPGVSPDVITGNSAADANASPRKPVDTGKPVVGFLYSISRQGIGEYWPLHIGQNSIGSSDKNDICLAEGTVSSDHATLVVRKMKKPEKLIASICDQRSTNGTMLNGESLGFNPVECFNNDLITIGENYTLVLILIDIVALGLEVAPGFIPVDRPTSQPFGDIPSMNPNIPFPSAGGTEFMDNPGFDHYARQSNNSGGQTTEGTVGM